MSPPRTLEFPLWATKRVFSFLDGRDSRTPPAGPLYLCACIVMCVDVCVCVLVAPRALVCLFSRLLDGFLFFFFFFNPSIPPHHFPFFFPPKSISLSLFDIPSHTDTTNLIHQPLTSSLHQVVSFFVAIFRKQAPALICSLPQTGHSLSRHILPLQFSFWGYKVPQVAVHLHRASATPPATPDLSSLQLIANSLAVYAATRASVQVRLVYMRLIPSTRLHP